MSHRLLSVLICTFALSACIDSPSAPAPKRYGSIALNTSGTGSTVTAAPVAVFFESSSVSIPDSRSAPDLCSVSAIVTQPGSASGALSAGDAITMTVHGTETLLPRTTVGNDVRYELPTGQTVTFTPGDTATFTVSPGGDFPAGSVAVKTAEAFTFEPVPVPTEIADPLRLRWTPAGGPSSAMIFQLRYATATSSAQNEQLQCVIQDDGDFIIEPAALRGWRAARAGSRDVLGRRIRTSTVAIGNDILHVSSTHTVTSFVDDPADAVESRSDVRP